MLVENVYLMTPSKKNRGAQERTTTYFCMVYPCNDLNDDDSHWLIYVNKHIVLNDSHLVDLGEGLGGIVLLEEQHH